MEKIGAWIGRVLDDPTSESVIAAVRSEVTELCKGFPLYEDLGSA